MNLDPRPSPGHNRFHHAGGFAATGNAREFAPSASTPPPTSFGDPAMSKKPTRREFLGAAAATAALGFAAPRLYAADAKASPNDTINLGVIGCGARAREVVPRFKALPGNRVVMVCDVNSQRMNEVREGFGDGKATACRRLPQGARQQGRRRRVHRHPGPLARPADDPGLEGRQGRLSREAAGQLHRRADRRPRGRQEVRPHRPDRHAAAELGAISQGGRDRPVGPAGR